MDDLHRNYIDGDWVDGEAAPDVNPSNTDEIVGHYVRGTADDAKRAIAAAKAAFPAWSRSGIQQRHDILKAASDEILKRREELGRLLAREEGKTLAEGIGETVRAGQIFDFFAGEALRLAGETDPQRASGHRSVDDPRASGRCRHHHAVEFPDRDSRLEDRAGALLRQHGGVQARRSGAGERVGDRRYSRPCRAAEGRAESRHGQWLGGRRRDHQLARRQRDDLHRVGDHRPQGRRRLGQAAAQVPAGDGRQESACRARRRRPEGCGRGRRQRFLFFHRPTLHGILAAGRYRRVSTTSSWRH